MGKILDAKVAYESLREKLTQEAAIIGQLTLASIATGRDSSCGVYISAQKKVAADLGIKYVSVELKSDADYPTYIKKITELNNDPKITGIIVNKPFAPGIKEENIFCAIDPKKDIEGLNPYNLGMLFSGKSSFISPTVLSVLRLLAGTGIDVSGKEVTIVGSSLLIGKPLGIILTNMFATVTITHIETYNAGNLPRHVSNADILISAVGKPNLIKAEWIKPQAIVIDVGTAVSGDKLAGDVEFEAAKKKASWITPVPGGVGKLTTLFLYHNLIIAAKLAGKT